MAYGEELVYIQSEDGLPLEGAVIRPAGRHEHPIALVHIHGLTGKFYNRSTVGIGRGLANRGYPFLTGNNRGHDFGYPFRPALEAEPRMYGGAWELFDESPLDIAGWIAYAAERGLGGQIALMGHSLGALKVCYYQALRQDPRVAGLIAASPPVRAGRLRPELVSQAEKMVAEGRGSDLLPWNSGPAGAGTHSAQSYLNRHRTNIDVYGYDTPNPLVGRITCPLLAFFGTNEEWVGGATELEVIRRNASAAARIDTRLLQGADHSYTGHEDEVAAAIADWLATLA